MATVLERLRLTLGVRSGLFFAYDSSGRPVTRVLALGTGRTSNPASPEAVRFLEQGIAHGLAIAVQPTALGDAAVIDPVAMSDRTPGSEPWRRVMRASGIVSQLGVVLRDGQRPVGCLLLNRLAREAAFTDDERRFVAAEAQLIEAGFVLAHRRIPISDRIRPLAAQPLSARELDVVRLVADGASNQEAAKELVITVATVKSHLYRVYRKLGVRTRAELVARYGHGARP